MRIDQFIYLVEVTKFESISLAAENLHVSQPTISQAINAMEIELGKKIFYRSRLGTQPTKDGKVIINKAKEILEKIDEIKLAANHSSKLLSGSLSISSVPGICTSLLPKTLVQYKKKVPLVSVKIFEKGTPQIVQDVITDKVDIGFVTESSQQMFANQDNLIFEKLIDGQVMACIGQRSPLSTRKDISIKEISEYPIVPFKPKYQMYQQISNLLHQYGEPNILLHSGNTAAGKEILAEGIGVGFCSSVTIENDPYFQTGKLVAIPISDEEIRLSYGYLKLKSRSFSIPANEFIKVLKLNLI